MCSTRPRLSAAVVYAGILIGLMTSPALSESATSTLVRLDCQEGQIARSTGAEWECADLPTGGGNGPNFVLQDADGDRIGTVTSVSKNFAEVFVSTMLTYDVEGVSKAILLESKLVGITPPKRRFRDHVALFTNGICTGDAYIQALSGHRSALWPAYVVPATDGTDKRLLFIATSQVPQGGVQVSSQAREGICESVSGEVFRVVPAEVVVPDLYSSDNFPTPFSLELQ